MKKENKVEKFCGNCSSHNPYRYPDLMFCSARYAQNKDPIVETLGCCDEWSMVNQECYCVKEALTAKSQR